MMRRIEITGREIILAIIAFVILTAVGLFISNGVYDKSQENNDKYFKALKVDNDSDTFQYAINTQVGKTLAEGEVKTVDPIKVDGLKGSYFALVRDTERYTQHTRQVSYKCGKRTCYRTETYWTWDVINSDTYMSKKAKFLGGEYASEDLNAVNNSYISTVSAGFHLRYKYYGTPAKFKGVLYTDTKNSKLNDSYFHHGAELKPLMEKKEKEAEKDAIIFLIVWEIISAGLAIGYTLLDNKFINGR